MKLILKVYALGLSLALASSVFISASASAPTSAKGLAHFQKSESAAQITIYGPAADALHKELSERDGARHLTCDEGTGVALGAFVCLKSDDAGTRCVTRLSADDEFLGPTGSCIAPKLSIIGVGNPPAVLDTRGLLLEFQEGGLE